MTIKLIKCIELDKVFKSALDAKRELNIDNSAILKVCKGERKSAGKHPITQEPLHWQFIELEV